MARLDDDLLGGTRALHNLVHLLEIVVALVDVHHNLVLAQQEGLLECGNLVASDRRSVLRLEVKLLQLGIGVVADLALTVGAAVERAIVHNDEHTVAGALQVELNHIDSHVDAVLEGLERVLGGTAPVASMGHDGDILGIMQQIVAQLLGA